VKFLVTGGAGFIGSYTIKGLLEDGYSVVSLDINSDLKLLRKVLTEKEMGRVSFIQGDICDLDFIYELFAEKKIERVIHLASLLVPDSDQNPLLAIRVNCIGFANLLEVCKQLRVKRMVFVSSVAVFGPPDKYSEGFVPDDAAHFPQSVYGACKSLNEYLANHYFQKSGVEAIGLRFPVVYGAFREHGQSSFVSSELIEKTTLKLKATVPYGDDEIDWLYVKDAVRAIRLAAFNPITTTQVFNVSGTLRPIREAVNVIRQIYPDSEIEIQPGKIGNIWKFDSRRIEKCLGFKPEYSLEEGLIDSLNLYRNSSGMVPLLLKDFEGKIALAKTKVP
jgi:nucleoside-diphosphate-sugar epimerase